MSVTFEGVTFQNLTRKLLALEDREKLANIPFPDSAVSASAEPSYKNPPPPQTPSISNAARKTNARKDTAANKKIAATASKKATARKRTRGNDNAAEASLASNSNSDSPQESTLDEARYTVSDDDEEDLMDIFSPKLPPNRLIVDSKVGAGGLTLYKTAEGNWLSDIELNRLANMARNSRIMSELGLEEAKRHLATKPRKPVEEKEPEPEDDREFSVARARTALPPREHRPRGSKQDIS